MYARYSRVAEWGIRLFSREVKERDLRDLPGYSGYLGKKIPTLGHCLSIVRDSVHCVYQVSSQRMPV